MSSHRTPRLARRRTAALAVSIPVALGAVLVTFTAGTGSAQAASGSHSSLVLERDARTFADAAAKNPPIYTLSYADARKALDSVQSGPVDVLPADISHRTLPVGPTGSVDIRIVRPQGATGKLPVIMYFHGGGWVLGDEGTHDRLVRQIANGAQAAVVFVDYARAPEARYPIAIEQAYAATAWVAQHGDELGVDGSRIAVAGDSVGGNMTAAVTLMAKERGGPALRDQVLFYPVTDANFNDDSYRQFANGPWLTRKAMQWFWDAYAPDKNVRNQILASPLRATLDQLKGLPKALVITDEADVLRDEGEAYADKLRAAGDDVTAVRYNGAIHDFVMLNALGNTNADKAAVDQATKYLHADLHDGS
ncbi:alpha/beta hydrolase [Kitasatospora sp. NPDC048296]|uniref:alpha/beta hydrolase n=1 Tax=Kitasatospora sp. NPDC048296 TaxID=3364048 RepID=UPI0037183A1E